MKRFFVLLVFFSSITCLRTGNRAVAQTADETVTLPEIVVSASRIPTTLEDMPGITTIGRDQIEEMRSANSVDLLRQVAGLHIDQPGGGGGFSSVYLRGSDPNFTLVMINGVKVNDPTDARGGTFDFSTLGVANIERIEIVRGPMSSVYGSDALAGAINIITRTGTLEPEYAMDFGAGFHGYYQGSVEARGPLGEISSYALNASYHDSGDIVDHSEFTGNNFSGQFDIYPSDALHIKAMIFYNNSHSESFPDDSGGPEYATYRERDERDSDDFTMGLEVNHDLLPWVEVDLKGSYYRREEDMKSPGVAPGIRDSFGIPGLISDNHFDRTTLEVSSLVSLGDIGRISIGADTQIENGESDSVLMYYGIPVPSDYDLDRQVSSAFMEARFFTPIGLTFHGGLRFDFPEDFDTEESPKLGVVYKIESTGTTLKASWGKGFKLPSFYALGHPFVGNPDLVPETSESYDFSIIQDFFQGKLILNANLFDSRYFDIIDFEEGPPPKMVNRSEVTARGAEIGVDVHLLRSLSLNSHFSYVKTNIKDTAEDLRNRPEWRGGFNVRWKPVSEVTLHLNTLYVGEVFDSSIPTGDLTLDDYTRVDVSGTWWINPKFQIGVMIDNLLDETYEEFVGFTSPGVQARATLRFLLQ